MNLRQVHEVEQVQEDRIGSSGSEEMVIWL